MPAMLANRTVLLRPHLLFWPSPSRFREHPRFDRSKRQEAFDVLSSLSDQLALREELHSPVVRIANDDL
jgi:hypothetical protein